MNNFHGSMMSLVDGVGGSMKSSFNTSTLSLMSVNTTSSISTRVHEFNNKGLYYSPGWTLYLDHLLSCTKTSTPWIIVTRFDSRIVSIPF